MLDLSEFANDPERAREGLENRLINAGTAADRAALHYVLWEICQVCGDEKAALRHLDLAMAIDPLQKPTTPLADAVRSVVVLAVPGSFQANVPLGMLLDDKTALYTLWLNEHSSTDADLLAHIRSIDPLPSCVFIGIAEDRRVAPVLKRAERLAAASGLSVINGGDRVAQVSRTGVQQLLSHVANVVVPRCAVIRASVFDNHHYPLLIRPISSHAGLHLRKIDSREELERYVSDFSKSDEFYVTDFFDYSGDDGLYRKYRVVFVNGVPFPVHLAIHDDWAVWYYNARMEQFPERRLEEARFMSAMDSYWPAAVLDGLKAIASAVGLDYFGLDFSVSPTGEIVVFEVETGMIVHDRDPVDIYPYKAPAVARIRRAVEMMVDA